MAAKFAWNAMSIHLMAMVFDLEFPSLASKMVMLVLADNANKQGYCWPSIATIADKSGLSERAVQKQMKILEEYELLKRTERKGHSTMYELLLFPPAEAFADPAEPDLTPERRAPLPPNAVHPGGERGAPPGVNGVHPEPSVEPPKEPKRERAAPFAPPTPEELQLHATKIGLPDREAQKFLAYHESKGWKVSGDPMKNWRSAMITWKLRWEEFRGSGGPSASMQTMIHRDELRSVQAKLDALRGSYSEHQAWSKADCDRFEQLKARKAQLKQLLGMQV